MKMSRIFRLTLAAIAAILLLPSCNDRQSYAELLRGETEATNSYLSNCQVITEIPSDTVFLTVDSLLTLGLSREDAMKYAPYYRMDENGDVYMQVVSVGDGDMATNDQLVYFRFNRYNLNYYYSTGEWYSEGNATDLGTEPTSFRYNNYSLESSYQWGSGIQIPLRYLPLNTEANLIVKSRVGVYNEQSSVIPYLYNIRYYLSRI